MSEQGPVGGSTELRRFEDDGRIPNNPGLALVVYRLALPLSEHLAKDFEKRFAANGWTNSWRNGIFDYHHFTATRMRFSASPGARRAAALAAMRGEVLALSAGDVAILPAGTGHKCESASEDFLVVGGYPDGRDFDICRGNPAEHDAAVSRIAKVPLPKKDPVFGKSGVVVWQDH